MPSRVDSEQQPLEVSYRPLAALTPYARNPRTHSEAQVAEIAASIREFGWTNPILVDGENGIIAGHGRLLAARQLGMTEVPVIELAGMSEAQKRAYVIAAGRGAKRQAGDVQASVGSDGNPALALRGRPWRLVLKVGPLSYRLLCSLSNARRKARPAA